MEIVEKTVGTVTLIRPKESLFNIDLRELVCSHDLLFMFVKRDIITRYKQTILGPLWYFVNPILTTTVYGVVFGRIADIPTDGLPRPLFYLSGICLWNYFNTCLTRTSTTFNDYRYMFGKVYFPRLVVPLSIVLSSLYTLGIQMLLFLGVYIYFLVQGTGVLPNSHILLLPLLLFLLAGLSLGFGLITTSLTTKYKDLTILFSFIVQLWMYATPVIYPLSIMPSDKQWIVNFNPVTAIMETFRFAVLGTGTFNWGALVYSFTAMLAVLALGVVIFNKVQRNFMDTV